MDPSPYEDNYLVHLCFHYIEKYFSSSPRHNLFPSPNHKGLLVFISHSFGEEGRKPSPPPAPPDGCWSQVLGEWQGMGTAVEHGDHRQKVNRERGERSSFAMFMPWYGFNW